MVDQTNPTNGAHMSWYLNETNTETVTIADVQPGDIITRNTDPDHGMKVYTTSAGRTVGKRQIKSSGLTWQADMSREVLRLRFDANGHTICATNR